MTINEIDREVGTKKYAIFSDFNDKKRRNFVVWLFKYPTALSSLRSISSLSFKHDVTILVARWL